MCGLGSFFKGRSQPSPLVFPLVNTASLLLTVFVGVTVNALIGAFVGSSVNDVRSRSRKPYRQRVDGLVRIDL